jgi:Dullard-like phosphatase family protein
VYTSLNDPIDTNKISFESPVKSSFKASETYDVRNSVTKLDFENHEPVVNVMHMFNSTALDGNNQYISDEDEEIGGIIKGLPKQSQIMIRSNEEHVVHSLQSLEYVSKLTPPTEGKYLPVHEGCPKYDDRKLAIFDMDETLVHTLYKRNKISQETKETTMKYDAKVPIRNPDGTIRYLFINIRPYVMEILKMLKKWYKIVVFTASLSTYANAILDYLDPNNEVFEGRYYRGHCHITKDRVYIKDLRIFLDPDNHSQPWSIKDMVLIDNAAHSFGFQIDNGIPMIPFYTNKEDIEMIHLYYYLQKIANEDGKLIMSHV